ncbi:hypothetical protein LED50_27320, partial [Salmonella enterica]|nr:hypothetical protein [Salmonella enterica]
FICLIKKLPQWGMAADASLSFFPEKRKPSVMLKVLSIIRTQQYPPVQFLAGTVIITKHQNPVIHQNI